MRWLFGILVVALIVLQFQLWIGEGSLEERARLARQIEQQKLENQQLRERNDQLAVEVESLKSDMQAIEEKARRELGMIKEGETFFMVVEPKKDEQKAQAK